MDANYIDAEPIRNHADPQMIVAYQKLWERTNRGQKIKPNLHILDKSVMYPGHLSENRVKYSQPNI
jgi:hypothetical protein